MTTAEWRAANPESHRESSRKWREKNRAKHQAYARAYYEAHREVELETKRVEYANRKRILDRFKLFKGCARCGYREHAAALNFHHRDPATKTATPSSLLRAGMDAVRREIAKCDVLCANCHAITHAEMA